MLYALRRGLDFMTTLPTFMTSSRYVHKFHSSHRCQLGSILVFAPGDPGSIPGGISIFSDLYFDVRGSLIPHDSRQIKMGYLKGWPVAALRGGNWINSANRICLIGLVMWCSKIVTCFTAYITKKKKTYIFLHFTEILTLLIANLLRIFTPKIYWS